MRTRNRKRWGDYSVAAAGRIGITSRSPYNAQPIVDLKPERAHASCRQSTTASSPLTLTRHYTKHAEGSVLVEFGDTKVLCTATVEEGVPRFLKGRGKVGSPPSTACCRAPPTAAMPVKPPKASRVAHAGDPAPDRALAARRGGSEKLGEFTITLDCDVLQADGGTRTASISGACVALADALNTLVANGKLKANPMKGMVAAVSVGIVNGEALCDLGMWKILRRKPT